MDVLARIGVRILETVFFAGWIGSLLVIILSAIEDIGVITGNHESEAVTPAKQARP